MEIDIQMISEILYESLMHPLTMAPLLGINLVLGAVIGVLVNVVGKVMGEGKTIDEVAHRTDGPYEIDGAIHGEQIHTCEPSDGRESVHTSDAGLGYGDLSPIQLDHVHADDHRHEYTPDCADDRTHDHTHGRAHDHAYGGSCVGESASPKELSKPQKKLIVDCLIQGNMELLRHPKNQTNEEYALMRKFAIILLRDITKGNNSLVKHEFSELLKGDTESRIKAAFNSVENKPDDDMNVSGAQTYNLTVAIAGGLKYPALNEKGNVDYNELVDFLGRLCEIFKKEQDLSLLWSNPSNTNEVTESLGLWLTGNWKIMMIPYRIGILLFLILCR